MEAGILKHKWTYQQDTLSLGILSPIFFLYEMRLFLIIGCYFFIGPLFSQAVNDECENAIEFTSIGTNEMWWCSNDRHYRISDATSSDLNDPTCHPDTNKILKDVWFRFTPTKPNITFVYNYDSSVIDMDKDPFPFSTRLQLFTISLYTGNCQERNLYTCKFFGDGLILRYRLSHLEPGSTYFMKVATPIDSLIPQNENDTVGNFQFCMFSDSDDVDPTLCSQFSISTSPDTLIDFGGTATFPHREIPLCLASITPGILVIVLSVLNVPLSRSIH